MGSCGLGGEITVETPSELVDVVVQTRKRKAFRGVAQIPFYSHLGLTGCQFQLFKFCVFLKTESYLPGTQGTETSILLYLVLS